MLGFLHNAHCLVLLVELNDTVAFRVIDVVAEHRGAMFERGCLAQLAAQTVAVEDVVAEHEGACIVTDEVLTEQEGLSQTVRAWLNLVLQRDAVSGAIAKQALEIR